MIEKLDMKTPDFTNENIAQIAALFPNCVTEMKDNKGNTKKVIDFDLLKQELSENIVDGVKERYSLTWPGKKEALVTANKPINKTLRPDVKDSVNFDTTQNLYIEGDNLEALKLLQESYLNKIKMIYIDPPYNTGKDFVYKDNFTGDKDLELEKSGQISEEGRLVANLESNGRYHSDWLSMMYPRLKLARNLLKEDGVIFISIDDKEIHNLRKLCDDIFGELNFIANTIWQSRTSISDDHEISMNHNHTLIYAKNYNELKFYGEKLDESDYSNRDNDPRGPWKLVPLDANKPGGDTNYPILNPYTNEEFWPPEGRSWAINSKTYKKLFDDNRIAFGINGESAPKKKLFYFERLEKGDTKTPSSILLDAGTTKNGSNEVNELLERKKIFSYPKPTSFISRLIQYAIYTEKDQIILDFFSGSGTTANAVLKMNSEDNGNRKFIAVQLPENLDEVIKVANGETKTIIKNSIDFLDSIKKPHFLTEIGKERIRRAGKKILEESGKTDLDIGFRVLKIDSSNMNDVYYSPDEITQDSLFDITVDNIKEGRTSLDLLFQVLLDSGIDLTLPIRSDKILDKEVFFVDENVLVACFEDSIDEAFVTEIAKMDDILKVVFKDSSFKSDDMRINVEQIFKQYSPDTDLKVI